MNKFEILILFFLFSIAKKKEPKKKMLLNDKGFRRLRTATKGAALGNRNFFLKKLSKTFSEFTVCSLAKIPCMEINVWI